MNSNILYFILYIAITLFAPFDILLNSIGAFLIIYIIRILYPTPNVPKYRRASFATRICASGVFPKKCKIPEPIIQGTFEAIKFPELNILGEYLKGKLAFYNRFRSIPEYDSYGDMVGWSKPIDIEDFNILNHLEEISFESKKEFNDFIDMQLTNNIDMDKPLWKIYIIRKSKFNPNDTAFVRVHHAIGDGLSLVQSFFKLFTNKNGEPITSKHVTASGKLKQNFFSIAFIKKFFAALFKVVAMPISTPDTKCSIKDWPYKYNASRHAVTMKPLNVEKLKHIKNELKCTINDVMVGIVTGMFRRYLERVKDPALKSKMLFRSLIPYSFPRSSKAEDTDSMRNLWCFISLEMPINIPTADPIGRVYYAKKQMDYLKSSPEAILQYKVNELVSHVMPTDVLRQTALDAMSRHSLVFTNVPGPDEQIYSMGEPITDFNVPIGNIIPQLSCFSYHGHLNCCVTVDPELFPDSDILAQLYEDEYNALINAL